MTLGEAATAIEMERVEGALAAADSAVDLDEISIRVSDRDVSLGDLTALEVARAAAEALAGVVSLQTLLARLRSDRAGDIAMSLLGAGYNPVALVDSERVEVVPDHVVSHRLTAGPSAFLVVGMLQPLRAAFRKIGRELPIEPTAMPAPRIWVTNAGDATEYAIYPGGPLGFELIRESARALLSVSTQDAP